ncbi:phage terminase small subunit [Enterococcus malodoratus]|uniref:terminase small subunit n=1 Tax=Enterococcus malodoratus TaxID=71451 RepID=UPI0008C173BD|nr:terminase small subunit [Enterococcus malodoratus]SEU00826.1 phage terminase small subunit [Enterococcus malodoratus]
MEKRELAFKLYKESNGEKPLIEIAKEIEASPGTVRGWKSRYKWDEALGTKIRETQRSVTRNVTKSETPKLVIDNDDLTEQQKMFCLFYLQHFNATKAYQQAYQCDYNTANANGSRLLVKASVKEELRNLKAELQQEQYFTVQDIIADYAKQWKADINDVITSDRKRTKAVDGKGQLVKDEKGEQVYLYYNTITAKNSNEFDGQLVKEITQGRDGVSVKLHDKQKAMNELMKYLGGDKLREAQLSKITGNDGTTDDQETWKQAVISAANKRAVKEDE